MKIRVASRNVPADCSAYVAIRRKGNVRFFETECVLNAGRCCLQQAAIILVFFICFMAVTVDASAQGNVEIVFVDKTGMTSVGPNGCDKNVKLTPVKATFNRDSITRIVQEEIRRYSPEALKKAGLTRVILVDRIDYMRKDTIHHSARGTYVVPCKNGNVVILEATSSILPAVFHHELSSLFYYQMQSLSTHHFSMLEDLARRFYNLTPYCRKDSVRGARLTDKFEWSPLSDNRYVLGNNGYAMVDDENDFNEIVKYLFTPKLCKKMHVMLVDNSQDLWQFLDRARRKDWPVYEKVMRVVALYNEIDPRFTEDYFRALEK